jgi:serine/threonine protein kinase
MPKVNLSPHVQTRPYRSPEVILYEQHYFQAIDIWSAGVVFAELF